MNRRSDEETIQRVLDGKMDAIGFEAFERRLLAEPELRALFRSYNLSHHLLVEKFGNSEPGVLAFRKPKRGRAGMILAIAACAAALAVATVFLGNGSGAAKVVFGPESHGRIIGDPGECLVPGGRIELEHGSASVDLPGGGRAYFEGPGTLECVASGELRLHEGRVWFGEGGSLVCETRNLRVVAGGAEFGLIADGDNRQELQVLGGEVELSANGSAPEAVGAGLRVAWEGGALESRNDALAFSAGFPRAVEVFSDDFNDPDYTPLAGKRPDVGGGAWTVERGGPVVVKGLLDTSSNTRQVAYAPLAELPINELSHVFLLTIETEDPGTHDFHSEGWAGVSLYTGDIERIFVGDPCGPEDGWALHPVGYEARHSCPLLHGKTTVTLRYDFRSGLAQLFEGTDTSGPALASEWISPGLSFDRIRIANGSQADAAEDAGKERSAAGGGPGVNIRSDIALRRISASVLCAKEERRSPKP